MFESQPASQPMRIEDMIITLAYFSIPVQIFVSLYRYPRLAVMPAKIVALVVLFALFIFLCGAGHLMRCLNYTETSAFYITNWCTAFISLGTATYLIPLVPNLMSSLDEGLQELRRLNVESEESRHKLVTFMAFLCHEMRNPLFAITSFSAFLEDENMSPNQERALSSIQPATQLMLRLVNDVLDISKLESGRLELEEEEFLLREMLQNVGSSTEMQLRQKPSVDFKFQLADNVPTVAVGDSARILQVAYNLLSNATKFTEEGSITFKTSLVNYDEALENQWILTNSESGDSTNFFDGATRLGSSATSLDTAAHDNDFETHLLSAKEGFSTESKMAVLKLEVSDTGAGIEQNFLERIFVPYSWSKLTDYREHGGTGLGLAIVSKLSRKMGGTIHVASAEGVGSTFAVYLQLRIPEIRPQYQRYTELWANTLSQGSISTLPEDDPLGPETYVQMEEGRSHALDGARLSTCVSSETIPPAQIGCQVVERVNYHKKRKPSLDLFSFEREAQKVLIVDDNQVNRKLLARMISHFRLEYELAANGQEAVDIIMKSRNVTGNTDDSSFGLIIMDLSMPVLDGCQATRILRERNVDLPILALTACPVDVSKQDALEAGVTEFLLKPILRKDLHRKCKYYLLGESDAEMV